MNRSRSRRIRARVWLFVPLLLVVLLYPFANVSPAQTPTKEYIPLGGRTLAVETFGVASGQISGRKIDQWGLFFSVPGAVLNIDGNAIQIAAGEQPFARTVSAGTHTIQAVAPGYSMQYHAAQNSYSHPAGGFQSAANNTITVTVPAGGFVDVDWMFTSTTNPSGTGLWPIGVYTTATSGTYDVFATGTANTDMAFAEVFSSTVGTSSNPLLNNTMFDDLIWYGGVDQGGGAWKNSIFMTNHRPGNPDFVLTYANSWLYGPGPNPTLLGSPTFSRYKPTITPPNSGFEAGALSEWGNTWGSGWVVTTAATRSGTYGLALTGGDSGVYQDIAGLIPGHRYRIKGFVRSSSASGGPNARLIVHDTTNANWNGNEQIATTSGFVEQGISFTATSTSMVRIHLGRQPGGSGNVHWDDVSVASANFVNPGFETGTLAGWGTYEPNIVATASQAQRVTGNYSVALSGGAGGITQQTTNPEPTAVTFYVEGWAKSSVAGTVAQLLALEGASNWQPPVTAALGTQWQKLAFEVAVPANGTLTVFAHRSYSDQTPGQTGVVYWDDLVVRAK